MFLKSADVYLFFISAIVLYAIELLYFRIADKFNIIDKPNHRSSHVTPTIRGGGIIFIIAVLAWSLWDGFSYWKFTVGICIIGIISFMDDIKEQPARLRFTVHTIAIILLFHEAGFFNNSLVLIIVAFIVVAGAINAFNFMDGINGITGIYAAVNVLTFLYLQQFHVVFTASALLTVTLSGIFVFLIFNFRVRARCFAGDVGSVSLAFLQVFFLLQLIQTTWQFGFVLLFLVFGIDSVITIINRLMNKENIFKPHRTHLYQFLANEFSVPHRLVSIIYGIVQVVVNASVVYLFVNRAPIVYYIAIGIGYAALYTIIRVSVIRKLSGQLNKIS